MLMRLVFSPQRNTNKKYEVVYICGGQELLSQLVDKMGKDLSKSNKTSR